jgi:hypothetical protein
MTRFCHIFVKVAFNLFFLVFVSIMVMILIHLVAQASIDVSLCNVLVNFGIAIFAINAGFADPFFVTVTYDVVSKVPDIKEGSIMSIACGDTPSSVEHDLPYAGNAR